jgi:flagellar hook assembly protein FlgD
MINIVPNPYYAYSGYETSQLDNRVKITNLPEKCTISIYTVNGTLIRQFTKDETKTSYDWDLKNYAGIPISGGIYLIHIKADGIGEKVIKWFGVLRPIDLNAF